MKGKKVSTTEVSKISNTEMEEAKKLSAQDLGAKVSEIRKKRAHLSQDELAEIIGTVQSAISEIENGLYPITMDLISRLAIALNANPLELAAAYWGINESEITSAETDFIEGITYLFEKYNKAKQKSRLKQNPPQLNTRIPHPMSENDTNIIKNRLKGRGKYKQPENPPEDGEEIDNSF